MKESVHRFVQDRIEQFRQQLMSELVQQQGLNGNAQLKISFNLVFANGSQTSKGRVLKSNAPRNCGRESIKEPLKQEKVKDLLKLNLSEWQRRIVEIFDSNGNREVTRGQLDALGLPNNVGITAINKTLQSQGSLVRLFFSRRPRTACYKNTPYQLFEVYPAVILR